MLRSKDTRFTWKDWWQKNAKKQKGVLVCDRCDSIFYDGHWHTDAHGAEAIKEHKPRSAKQEALCPACTYVMSGEGKADSDFEGQVTLDGLFDAKEKAEVLLTIRNLARASVEKDPQDQVIAIDDKGDRVIIATSDNQLAVRMGKKIDESFKGGTLRIVFSDDDLPTRVYWKHKETRQSYGHTHI